MRGIGTAMIVLGVLLFVGGLAMPATQTHTATTCVDSGYDAADGCVQTNYSSPNFGRTAFIGLGVAVAVGGFIATSALSDGSATAASSIERSNQQRDSSGERADEETTAPKGGATGSLVDQLERRDERR